MSLYPGILSMPQLFKKAVMFNQNPVVNGGYNDQTPGVKVRVIFQDEKSGAKLEGGAWVATRKKTVWSLTKLVTGAFFYFESTVFRIMTDQDWQTQSGYFVYDLEKVIGDNGKPSYDPKANLGGRDFA
jgi:hypothetical protein